MVVRNRNPWRIISRRERTFNDELQKTIEKTGIDTSICVQSIGYEESRQDSDSCSLRAIKAVSDPQSQSCLYLGKRDRTEELEEKSTAGELRLCSQSTGKEYRYHPYMDHPCITCEEKVKFHVTELGSVDIERVPSFEAMPAILGVIRLRPESVEEDDGLICEDLQVGKDAGSGEVPGNIFTRKEKTKRNSETLEQKKKKERKATRLLHLELGDRSQHKQDEDCTADSDWYHSRNTGKPQRGRSRRPRSRDRDEHEASFVCASALTLDAEDSSDSVSTNVDPVRPASPSILRRSFSRSVLSIKYGLESVANWSKRDQRMDIEIIEDCETCEMEDQDSSYAPPEVTKPTSTPQERKKFKKKVQSFQTKVHKKQEKLCDNLAVQYTVHKRLVKKKRSKNKLEFYPPQELKQAIHERFHREKGKIHLLQQRIRKSIRM